MYLLFFAVWLIFNGQITLEIVLFGLAVAAAVCCVIAYWDKITECVHGVGRALGLKCCQYPSEYDDYADWDE